MVDGFFGESFAVPFQIVVELKLVMFALQSLELSALLV
jgi:hypothetical protein